MRKAPLALALLILSLFITMDNSAQAPANAYEKEWKKVEEFVKKQLPQSAIAEVKKIYALAKSRKQEDQQIKSLIYLTSLQSETREENQKQSIRDWEKELSGKAGASRAIIHSIIAQQYRMYYQYNRWQLYNRTATSSQPGVDIGTWTEEQLHERVIDHFEQSLADVSLLQRTSLSNWDAIIIKGNARNLRPTLFDLLAHRALDYYKSGEATLTAPTQTFELDMAAAFDPAADFVHRRFSSPDSTSLEWKALLLFQQLIQFHLNDEKSDALIDVDLDRIAFAREKSVHPDKDELYLLSVNHIAHQYGDLPAAAMAWFYTAQYHNQLADQYNPLADTSHRFARLKALEIAEKIIQNPLNTKAPDTSLAWYNAYQLIKEIKNPDFSLEVEIVNLPDQPFRALVSYKNIATLQLRLVKMNSELERLVDGYVDDENWAKITRSTPIRTWQQPLPATGDYQKHRVEIKLDGLEQGKYLLLASNNPFSTTHEFTAGYGVFHVSNISYVKFANDYFVVHRGTGQPLAGATVQEWKKEYDSQTGGYVRRKGLSYVADNDGHYQEKLDEGEKTNRYKSNFFLEISYKNDRLAIDNQLFSWHPNKNNNNFKPTPSLFLFTDRKLYRPGQTLFVKGLLVQRDNEVRNPAILQNRKTTLYLRDANGQDVDSIQVTSNEYGSFHTKFKLPSSGLNGMFSISARNEQGSAYVHVEEYKRPKFEVNYEPIKEAYRVNDTVRVKGIAKAYAGNNIDGASVSYRVVRRARMLFPWYGRGYLPPAREKEIAHGQTTTDADGTFSISFVALPDLKIEKDQNPVFDYEIFADVTDLNGETRSSETFVTAAYTALQLEIDMPAQLDADSLQTVRIRTSNRASEFQKVPVTVKVQRLKAENRLIRERFWEEPDQFIMTKEEYIRLFPHDEYSNEADFENWAKGEVVMTQTDSSQANGYWNWQNKKWTPGFYVVEFSINDPGGTVVKLQRFVEIVDEKQTVPNRPQYLHARGSEAIEPGERTDVKLTSAVNNPFVVQIVQRPSVDEEVQITYKKWTAGSQIIDFTATEADRGGYGVSWGFVKDNRFHSITETIQVPWTNKELQIEYLTYRDKTRPGSRESWKIRISGNKKEKLAAEVLASMYDASLDQFYPHAWIKPLLYTNFSGRYNWEFRQNFGNAEISHHMSPIQETIFPEYTVYDHLADFGYEFPSGYFGKRGEEQSVRYMRLPKDAMSMSAPPALADSAPESRMQFTSTKIEFDAEAEPSPPVPGPDQKPEPVPSVRKNFDETAFFLPDLQTDADGNIEFSFTLPEALTRWKLQTFAHTKELQLGYNSLEIVTQKELMLQPNPPRFLREGDQIELTAKVVNLTEAELSGQVRLELLNAATLEPLDSRFRVVVPRQYFTASAGQSAVVAFQVEVPFQFTDAITWRMIAESGKHSDGEEASLPVLSNRLLVTESMPIYINGTGGKNFSFEKLKNSGQSESLQQHRLTVEYSSNPAWYAVQALPYLTEFPYECAEQTWNRYYANALAQHIAGSSPRIRAIFDEWKNADTAALLSNLQKNQELKTALLEETPWVLEAKTEAEQKQRIALLFDMVRMRDALSGTLEKLKNMQNENGSFSWFKGGPDDRFITQYILTGIGHLQKLGALPSADKAKLNNIISAGLQYLDQNINNDYQDMLRRKLDLKKQQPSTFQVQYLYMRSFFPETGVPGNAKKAVDYFRSRLPAAWLKQNKLIQAMIALVLHRQKDARTPAAILRSLKETSIFSEEMGRYHKINNRGWFWYEAPVERQALLIEAFSEISRDTKTVDELRTWLLKNKQTNSWESTKATAEAVYALLLKGSNWLDANPVVTIQVGDEAMFTNGKAEAGTGYFKQSIVGEAIKPNMGNIRLQVEPGAGQQQTGSSWGAVYWQYFEDMDKVTAAATPLQLKKQLFVQRNTDRGPVLEPIEEGQYIQVGDKVVVRVELKADRDMEYVHMKDLRAASLEPVDVLSGYRWNGTAGYYQSTRDVATHFFFEVLRKGTYVFEYALFANHAGDFSAGVTSIECMYAPEFRAHSNGERLRVRER
ncbi:MAG: alpha-2-macroglobulin family protein [Chitinophagaceae bacterium]